MDIQTLQEIKAASTEALKGRQKLSRMHDSYIKRMHEGACTRRQTTTYNAKTATIMEYQVTPNENLIKRLALNERT